MSNKQVDGKPVKDSLAPVSRSMTGSLAGAAKVPSNKRGQGTS